MVVPFLRRSGLPFFTVPLRRNKYKYSVNKKIKIKRESLVGQAVRPDLIINMQSSWIAASWPGLLVAHMNMSPGDAPGRRFRRAPHPANANQIRWPANTFNSGMRALRDRRRPGPDCRSRARPVSQSPLRAAITSLQRLASGCTLPGFVSTLARRCGLGCTTKSGLGAHA